MAAEEETTTNETQTPVCGDGSCNGDETWETCSQDCPVPQQVLDARDAVERAEEAVSEGGPGFSTLQEMRSAIRDGRYSEAEQLAEQAIAEAEQAGGIPPWLPIVAGIVVMALVAAAVYAKRDRIEAIIDGIRQEKESDVEDPLGPVRTDN